MAGAGDRTEGVEQLTRGGALLGQYSRYDATPPAAELFEVKADLDVVVDAILTDLAGWNLTTTDEALAAKLVDRGALPTRHFSMMTIDITRQGESLADAAEAGPLHEYGISPLTVESQLPREVIDLVRSAYPPGHPDEELGSDGDILRELGRALAGDRLGPLMDMSALVFDGDRPIGLVMVNRVPGAPPIGGPWITDLCRDPDRRYAGLGRAILVRTLDLARSAGEVGVSLAVTEGNPARRLYESLGFGLVATTQKVRLPG